MKALRIRRGPVAAFEGPLTSAADRPDIANRLAALRISAAVAALQPAALLLPAIVLAALTTYLRGAGTEATLRTVALGIAAMVVLIVPGQVALHSLGWQRDLLAWEQLPRAFALSTLVWLALASLLMTAGVSLNVGLVVLGLASVLGLVRLAGRPPALATRPQTFALETWFVVGLWTLIAVAVSLAGTPITGEEEYELVTMRKIAENATLAWDNLMHHPGELTTYLVTPHYFQIAAIANLTGGELVGTYAKMRLFDVLLAGAAMYAVGRAILGTYRGALITTLLAAIWVVLDPAPNSLIASLLPLARRGSIAAGILLPTACAITFDALRKGGFSRVAIAGLLCMVTAMTHALEGAHFFLVDVAAVLVGGVVALAGRRDFQFARRAVFVLAASVICLGAFRVVHAHVATDVAAYEAPRQVALLQLMQQRLQQPVDAIFGTLTPEGDYVLRQTLPFLPAATIALVAGAVLAPLRRTPYLAAAWTVLGIAVLMHLVPIATLLAMYLTTSEIYLVFGILTAMTVPVIAAGVEAMSTVLLAGLRRLVPSWVAGLVVIGLSLALGFGLARGLKPLIDVVNQTPWLFGGVVAGVLVAAGLLRSVVQWRVEPRGEVPLAIAVLAAACVGIPVAVQAKTLAGPVYSNDRTTLLDKSSADWQRPDPLDFTHYYPTLLTLGLSPENRNALAVGQPVAPLFPYEVVQWLRTVIPPQRVVLTRPERIYSVAVMLDDYIVHAGFGLADTLDTEYLTSWVPQSDGHPFFGAPADPVRQEQFLQHWRVDYIVVDPDHQATTRAQLDGEPERFQIVAEYGGYSVYRVF